jgi:hypothetical protein
VIAWTRDTSYAHFARLGVRFEDLWGPLAHVDRLAERSCMVSKSTRPHSPHVVGVARRMRMKQPTLQARRDPLSVPGSRTARRRHCTRPWTSRVWTLCASQRLTHEMTVPGPLFPLESGPDIARSRTLVGSQPSRGPSLMKLRQGRWAWGNIEEPARSRSGCAAIRVRWASRRQDGRRFSNAKPPSISTEVGEVAEISRYHL